MATAGPDGGSGYFGELLLRHRTAAGLSQRALARRSGLSERAVRDLERGATARPRQASVRAVAGALGLTGHNLVAFLAAADGGPAEETPSAAALSTRPLPLPGGFVGRAAELRVLFDLVAGGRYRLITVTGLGGVGKSRLAEELVALLRRSGPAGVYTLDLSALAEPELVGELIAAALGAGGESRLPPVERVAAELGDRRAVVVLDCFERLVAAAPQVEAMVRRCPGLTVLVTSQRPLGVRGERRVRLAGLPAAEAVDLFARRAQAANPAYALTPANRAAVAAICTALDGLPLAVELAAARMRLLTPAELAARLDRPLRVLADGPVSLRTTITASLDVAAEPARTLFAWLAPFVAGVRLVDLEAVLGRAGLGHDWLLEALAGLVDLSLVRTHDEAGTSRYVLPDAMRELAGELLSGRPERSTVEGAMARHYRHRLDAAARRPDGGGYAELEADVDNLRHALSWTQRYDVEAVDSALVEALYRYYELRGRFAEGAATLIALADAGAPGTARALLSAGRLRQRSGQAPEGDRLIARGQAALAPDDRAGHAQAGMLLGVAAIQRGDLTAAAAHTTAALRAAEGAGDTETVGKALHNLAGIAVLAGDFRDGAQTLRRALAVKRSAGANDADIGRTLVTLADLALADYDWVRAADEATEAVAVLARGDHARLRALALSSLALALLGDGRGAGVGRAVDAMAEAVELLPAVDDDQPTRGLILARHSLIEHAAGRRGDAATVLIEGIEAMRDGHVWHEVPPIIEAHAALASRRDPGAAAELLGLAGALREHGASRQPPPVQPAARTEAVCREALGERGFTDAYRRGAARFRDGVPVGMAGLITAALAPG